MVLDLRLVEKIDCRDDNLFFLYTYPNGGPVPPLLQALAPPAPPSRHLADKSAAAVRRSSGRRSPAHYHPLPEKAADSRFEAENGGFYPLILQNGISKLRFSC